jgi:membrane protein
MNADEHGPSEAGDRQRTVDQKSVGSSGRPSHGRGAWHKSMAAVRFSWALYRGYSRRGGSLLSAGIAYYLLFSLAPLTFLTLRIASHFVDPAAAAGQLRAALTTYLGPELADLFVGLLIRLSSPSWTTQTVIIGGALLLYGASRLVVRAQTAFNIMWDIRVTPARFSFRRLLSRLLLYSLLLIPSAILLAAIALFSGSPLLGGLIENGFLLDVSQMVIAFLFSWTMLMLVFALLPDIRISARECWRGALLTAVLCGLGTRLYGAFMFWSDNPKYVGSVGALIALIVWADFMAIITLLGVRLNKVLYESSGKTIQPYEYAVLVEDPGLPEPAESDQK